MVLNRITALLTLIYYRIETVLGSCILSSHATLFITSHMSTNVLDSANHERTHLNSTVSRLINIKDFDFFHELYNDVIEENINNFFFSCYDNPEYSVAFNNPTNSNSSEKYIQRNSQNCIETASFLDARTEKQTKIYPVTYTSDIFKEETYKNKTLIPSFSSVSTISPHSSVKSTYLKPFSRKKTKVDKNHRKGFKTKYSTLYLTRYYDSSIDNIYSKMTITIYNFTNQTDKSKSLSNIGMVASCEQLTPEESRNREDIDILSLFSKMECLNMPESITPVNSLNSINMHKDKLQKEDSCNTKNSTFILLDLMGDSEIQNKISTSFKTIKTLGSTNEWCTKSFNNDEPIKVNKCSESSYFDKNKKLQTEDISSQVRYLTGIQIKPSLNSSIDFSTKKANYMTGNNNSAATICFINSIQNTSKDCNLKNKSDLNKSTMSDKILAKDYNNREKYKIITIVDTDNKSNFNFDKDLANQVAASGQQKSKENLSNNANANIYTSLDIFSLNPLVESKEILIYNTETGMDTVIDHSKSTENSSINYFLNPDRNSACDDLSRKNEIADNVFENSYTTLYNEITLNSNKEPSKQCSCNSDDFLCNFCIMTSVSSFKSYILSSATYLSESKIFSTDKSIRLCTSESYQTLLTKCISTHWSYSSNNRKISDDIATSLYIYRSENNISLNISSVVKEDNKKDTKSIYPESSLSVLAQDDTEEKNKDLYTCYSITIGHLNQTRSNKSDGDFNRNDICSKSLDELHRGKILAESGDLNNSLDIYEVRTQIEDDQSTIKANSQVISVKTKNLDLNRANTDINILKDSNIKDNSSRIYFDFSRDESIADFNKINYQTENIRKSESKQLSKTKTPLLSCGSYKNDKKENTCKLKTASSNDALDESLSEHGNHRFFQKTCNIGSISVSIDVDISLENQSLFQNTSYVDKPLLYDPYSISNHFESDSHTYLFLSDNLYLNNSKDICNCLDNLSGTEYIYQTLNTSLTSTPLNIILKELSSKNTSVLDDSLLCPRNSIIAIAEEYSKRNILCNAMNKDTKTLVKSQSELFCFNKNCSELVWNKVTPCLSSVKDRDSNIKNFSRLSYCINEDEESKIFSQEHNNLAEPSYSHKRNYQANLYSEKNRIEETKETSFKIQRCSLSRLPREMESLTHQIPKDLTSKTNSNFSTSLFNNSKLCQTSSYTLSILKSFINNRNSHHKHSKSYIKNKSLARGTKRQHSSSFISSIDSNFLKSTRTTIFYHTKTFSTSETFYEYRTFRNTVTINYIIPVNLSQSSSIVSHQSYQSSSYSSISESESIQSASSSSVSSSHSVSISSQSFISIVNSNSSYYTSSSLISSDSYDSSSISNSNYFTSCSVSSHSIMSSITSVSSSSEISSSSYSIYSSQSHSMSSYESFSFICPSKVSVSVTSIITFTEFVTIEHIYTNTLSTCSYLTDYFQPDLNNFDNLF